jgi:hypothetical protein
MRLPEADREEKEQARCGLVQVFKVVLHIVDYELKNLTA